MFDSFLEDAVSESLCFGIAQTLKNRRICITGRDYCDFATSDYLGMSSNPEVCDVAQSVLATYGLGRRSSPYYYAPPFYQDIERKLIKITKFPEILLFSSSSLANLAAIKYGLPRNAKIFADQYCHRSLIEACKFRANYKFYKHVDAGDLALKIAKSSSQCIAVVTDGTYSMSGEKAPFQELCKLVNREDVFLVIDDTHRFGIDGLNGEGSLSEIRNMSSDKVIYVGNFSKMMPGLGAFVACTKDVADKIKQYSPQYGFSCNLPLIYAALNAWLCNYLGTEQWCKSVIKLKNNWTFLSDALKRIQRPLMAGFSPVAVLRINDADEMRRISLQLREDSIAFNVAGFPAIPRGEYRLRFCLSADHTQEDVVQLATSLKRGLKA